MGLTKKDFNVYQTGRDKSRDSNLELLRIFAALGVVILHYNGMGGGLTYVETESINGFLLCLMESAANCAVDVFVLQSAFFLCRTNQRDLWKVLSLILEVIVFSILIYLVSAIFGNGVFTVEGLLVHILPNNWFVMLYVALYFISPFLNKLYLSLDGKQRKLLLIIVVVLFSFWTAVVNVAAGMLGSSYERLSMTTFEGDVNGYTIVNFVLLYLIGCGLYYDDVQEKRRKWVTVLLLAIVLITIWSFCERVSGVETGAWSYANPLVVLEAVSFFQLFRYWRIPRNRMVNRLAAASFTVYIVHPVFLPYLREGFFVQQSWYVMVGEMLLSAIVIYLICWILCEIYGLFYRPLNHLISSRWKRFRKLEVH